MHCANCGHRHGDHFLEGSQCKVCALGYSTLCPGWAPIPNEHRDPGDETAMDRVAANIREQARLAKIVPSTNRVHHEIPEPFRDIIAECEWNWRFDDNMRYWS